MLIYKTIENTPTTTGVHMYAEALATITSTTTDTTPLAPWWGRVIVGFLLMAVAGLIGWAQIKYRRAFDDIAEAIQILLMLATMALMAISVGVVLWGLGVNFS